MWHLLLISKVLSQSCPIYSCHVGGFSISPNCAMLSPTNDYILQVCDQPGLGFCDVTGTITQNYTCASGPTHKFPLAYPGEYCRSDSDCITNMCEGNYCQGQNAGGACVSNSDCNLGFYCSPGFYCVPQLSYGQPCSNDFQCQNNLACNRTLFDDGYCVYYFGIPIGGYVGMCIDMLTEGVSNLCASGTCQLISNTSSIGKCTNVIYSPSLNFPRICAYDSDCLGIDGSGYKATGVCSCGMDQHGFAYCDAFSGDPPAQTLQYLYELHVNSSGINQCHTQRRFDYFCISQNLGGSATHLFNKMLLLSTDTARYQGNDFCAQQIFNSQYFDVGPTQFACPAYGCANIKDWTAGVCLTYTQGTNSFAINPCNSQSQFPYCDTAKSATNKWRNITCGVTPTVIVRYPGESCTDNSQCISGSCSNYTCDGIAQGGLCTNSDYCDIGLYCVSKDFVFTCQPLIQAYNSGCGSDFDCVPYCGCSYTSAGPPGICVPYFSLGNGNTTSCSNGVSLLCSSGSCYGQGFSGVCTTAPVSTTPLGTPCTYSGSCKGKNSQGQSFSTFCTCGYNNQGYSYCNPFMGDAPGAKYLSAMKKYYNAGGLVNNCQTTRRFSSDCYNTFDYSFQKIYLNFTQFPLFIGNDQCVKAVYTSSFWTAPEPHPQPFVPPYEPGGKQRKETKHDDFAGLLAVVALGLII